MSEYRTRRVGTKVCRTGQGRVVETCGTRGKVVRWARGGREGPVRQEKLWDGKVRNGPPVGNRVTVGRVPSRSKGVSLGFRFLNLEHRTPRDPGRSRVSRSQTTYLL